MRELEQLLSNCWLSINFNPIRGTASFFLLDMIKLEVAGNYSRSFFDRLVGICVGFPWIKYGFCYGLKETTKVNGENQENLRREERGFRGELEEGKDLCINFFTSFEYTAHTFDILN